MLLDHVHGCLLGVAVGDAMGMPTEGMGPDEITATYGWVDRLLPGRGRDLVAGQVTDDTEQTVMLAEAVLAAGGEVRAEVVTEHLLTWVADAGPRAAAVIGPSTARALELLRSGADPRTTGAGGRTNGAAMRIAPVGVVMPPHDLPALVDAVEESCVMSHHTGEAVAGAAAVAGVISSAVEAGDGSAAPGPTRQGPVATDVAAGALAAHIDVGCAAAALGARRGGPPRGASVVDRCREAVALAVATEDDATFLRRLYREIGASVATVESVPAAFGCLARADADPYRAAVLAANLGGDTDTVAAMAAGMAGAVRGAAAVPEALAAVVVAVNALPLEALARRLVVVRRGRTKVPPTDPGACLA